MSLQYSAYQTIEVSFSQDHKVATVLLNRPEKRNGWTPQMSIELEEVYTKLDLDADVRVVIMTGAGKAFCFGADLGSGRNPFTGDSTDAVSHRDTGGVAALAIWKCRKVTIAAVNGPAVGIGMTVILPMDLRISYSSNKCGFVFGARGVNMEAASSFFLPKLVGMSNALALITTAQVVSASHDWMRTLFAILLDKPEDVVPKAEALAQDIAKRCSAVAHAMSKTLMWHQKDGPEAHHLLDSMGIFISSERDGMEGFKSFLEKREPSFTDSVEDATIRGYLRAVKARL